jgi:hypothetical protein
LPVPPRITSGRGIVTGDAIATALGVSLMLQGGGGPVVDERERRVVTSAGFGWHSIARVLAAKLSHGRGHRLISSRP